MFNRFNYISLSHTKAYFPTSEFEWILHRTASLNAICIYIFKTHCVSEWGNEMNYFNEGLFSLPTVACCLRFVTAVHTTPVRFFRMYSSVFVFFDGNAWRRDKSSTFLNLLIPTASTKYVIGIYL